MMWTSHAAAQAISAQAIGTDAEFVRVTTDSRQVQSGDLFIALRGDKFDGHDYVVQALAQGAAAVVIDKQSGLDVAPAIMVDDTRLALGLLASAWRQRMPARVLAITGSSGKTSVKEMLAAILRDAVGDNAVLATQGNLNNDIGMPLTLLRLRLDHQYAVVEMGMNHAGEIAYLTELAHPDVAAIINAGTAHIGMLGSQAAIAAAKGEILAGLGQTGVAVINADDGYAAMWRELAGTRRVVDFGLVHAQDVRATYRLAASGSEITLQTGATTVVVHLAVAGEHNVMNALAAAAMAQAVGINVTAIKAGLESYQGVKGRLQRKTAKRGGSIIDDSYNANPDSTLAAIAVLAAVTGRKILVLGDMGELGDDAAAMHAQIGTAAKQAGIDALYALGELSAQAVNAFGAGAQHYSDLVELADAVNTQMTAGVTALVKGSRFMQMERVVKILEEQA
jgi:UDP-N-acetylmuramoyl-tripeptide--D-alanyl-D-alanine ligase